MKFSVAVSEVVVLARHSMTTGQVSPFVRPTKGLWNKTHQ